MKLSQVSVKRPVTTTMLFIAILLFGLVAMMMLKIDILPKIEYPVLTVLTIYPGSSADQVEEQITKILEQELAGISNLKSIKSKSKENVSFIILEFNWGIDLSEAVTETRDKIEIKKRYLPDDAEPPILIKVTSSMLPVLYYSVTANESYAGLEKITEDKISNHLKKVKGVGSLLIVGQPTRQIKIDVDPFKLKAYHLSSTQIAKMLDMENLNLPAGSIKFGKNDLAVRIPGAFESVTEIADLAITSRDGKIIHLKDVATVTDDFKEKDEILHSDQQRGIGILIQKQSDANTLDVAKAVQKEVDKIKKTLPADVEIKLLGDSSELISASINNMASTIGWAGLFVMLVVFVFLREWRSSLIIILTIPFSLIVAFIFMYIADYTINIFSLMALAIAIGMVVDNAIVVLENITRHVEAGSKPHEAAIFGSGEMGMAISASTLTTVAVFLPMVFVGGLVGILFKQLALLTSITLLASLFTALALTPMLASRLIKPAIKTHVKHGKLFRYSELVFESSERIYEKTLGWAIRHRVLVIVGILVIFLFTLLLGTKIGSDYIPEFDAGDVAATFELEVGVSAEESERMAKQIENIFTEEIPESDLRSLFAIIGQTETGGLSIMGFEEGKNRGNVIAKLVVPKERNYSSKVVANHIRDRIAEIPEIEHFVVSGGSLLGSAIQGNVSPIEIRISGSDLDEINNSAQNIVAELQDLPYIMNQETTIDQGKLEFLVHIDRRKAQRIGLNTAIIALTVRQSIFGAEAKEYKEDGDEYEMLVRYAPAYRNNPNQLKNIMLTTMTGKQVPLSLVATIEEGRGPLEIKHESQQRVVYITSDLKDISLSEGVNLVRQKLEQMEFSPNVTVEMGGQFIDQQESFSNLYLLFALGIILVYMVMAAQFESFRHPFIIMFAIPLSIIGVIWAFFITGTTLSVVTFLGVIMLLGIVVNNGIVLVDYTNLLRARGRNLLDAVQEAGHSRLRPVLMTAFTTIFAMVPMALSSGMGSEMWSPMGTTVIGGLLVATGITLILIPVMYTSMHHKELKKIEKNV